MSTTLISLFALHSSGIHPGGRLLGSTVLTASQDCKSAATAVVTKSSVNFSSTHLPILGLSICTILYFSCFFLCTHLSGLSLSSRMRLPTSQWPKELLAPTPLCDGPSPSSFLQPQLQLSMGVEKAGQAMAETIRNCQLEPCASEPSTAGLLISRCVLVCGFLSTFHSRASSEGSTRVG